MLVLGQLVRLDSKISFPYRSCFVLLNPSDSSLAGTPPASNEFLRSFLFGNAHILKIIILLASFLNLVIRNTDNIDEHGFLRTAVLLLEVPVLQRLDK